MVYTTLIIGNKTILLSICLFSMTNIFFRFLSKNSKNDKLDKLIDKNEDIEFKLNLIKDENVKKTEVLLSLLRENKGLLPSFKSINDHLNRIDHSVSLINSKLDKMEERKNNYEIVSV